MKSNRLLLALIVILASILTGCSSDTTSYTFSISNIVFSPPSPSNMAYGAHVEITYDYSTNFPYDFRIRVEPYTDGSLSENSDSVGTFLHPKAGREHGSITTRVGHGWLSIDSKGPSGSSIVDQIHFLITDEDDIVLLYEIFMDVNYTYGPSL